MLELLIFIVAALFLVLLFLNLYFRIKVLKSYKILVQNQVEFESSHFFNQKKMKSEVISRYPHLEKEILTFVHHIQYSVKLASVFLFLITVFGAILMYFKN
jgi:hypothetical protein